MSVNTSIITLGQVYKPVIYNDDTGDVYTNPVEDFECILMDLADKFITAKYHGSSTEKQRQEDLVLDLYNEAREYVNDIPSIDDVMGLVTAFNDDIVHEVALVDYANNYSRHHPYVNKEWIDEYIRELVFEWHQDLYMEYFNELDDWVEDILNKHNMAYYAGAESGVDELINRVKDIKVVFNDCQNLLNPEWSAEGMRYLDDYIHGDLTKIQVVSI